MLGAQYKRAICCRWIFDDLPSYCANKLENREILQSTVDDIQPREYHARRQRRLAAVVELVDTLASGVSASRRGGSSPPLGTK